MTFSTVASRHSIRMLFLLAAFNNLKIIAGDMGNAYLNTTNKERAHIILGPELFGPDFVGERAIIV